VVVHRSPAGKDQIPEAPARPVPGGLSAGTWAFSLAAGTDGVHPRLPAKTPGVPTRFNAALGPDAQVLRVVGAAETFEDGPFSPVCSPSTVDRPPQHLLCQAVRLPCIGIPQLLKPQLKLFSSFFEFHSAQKFEGVEIPRGLLDQRDEFVVPAHAATPRLPQPYACSLPRSTAHHFSYAFCSDHIRMPYHGKTPDELIDLIYELVDRLVQQGPEESRHDRANLGNEIVLCASVLRQRIGEMGTVPVLGSATSEPSTPAPAPTTPREH
jgi:hypothetical protein